MEFRTATKQELIAEVVVLRVLLLNRHQANATDTDQSSTIDDAGSPAGFILHGNASIHLYHAQNAAKSTGGLDLAQYAPASHAGNRKRN